MRNKILTILLNNQDSFVSGEMISDGFNVTRAAVWKHIKSLQQEGFVIESVSKRGYKLVGIPEKLDEITLLAELDTEELGRTLEIHQSIGSTNNRAKELALSGCPEGTLVIAEEQIAGRGRMGRRWISPPEKGIWMSLVLKPGISPEEAPRITAMAAVSAERAIKGITGLPIGIKWPNDIIVHNKKVCGILTEIHADLDTIHYVIVGMGINVNTEQKDFPQEIAASATSLRIESGQKVDRRQVIRGIMKEMEEIYHSYLENHDFTPILDECRRCSVTLGQRVKVIGRDVEFEGRAMDFTEEGALLVLRDSGEMEKVLSGDVSIRGIAGYV